MRTSWKSCCARALPRWDRELVIALVLAAACGSGDSQAGGRDTLTERQKDSILAKSRIPGASGVGRAMTAADSTSAGARRVDSVAADTAPR